jgi:hypothetical protein
MDDKILKLFTTTFVGNIAIFEEEMGSLWGHGKLYADLTTSEKIWRETWKRVRDRIFDHSNKQLRKVTGE